MSSPNPTAAADVAAKFRYWQYRTLIATMFGYAAFYFVRKNLSFAMPAMQADLGITKADLGLFLTLHGLLYGLSRFVNGMRRIAPMPGISWSRACCSRCVIHNKQ